MVVWGQNKLRDRENLEKYRSIILGKAHSTLNRGFWSDRSTLEIDKPEKIRILVCGNTGVGKSTLINRVFGLAPSKGVVSFFFVFFFWLLRIEFSLT